MLRAGGEQELENVAGDAAAAGLPVQVIQDAGHTQIAEGTVTCCAVGPAEADKIDAITSSLPLR